MLGYLYYSCVALVSTHNLANMMFGKDGAREGLMMDANVQTINCMAEVGLV